MGAIIKNGIVYNSSSTPTDLTNYITKDDIEGFETENINFEELLEEEE